MEDVGSKFIKAYMEAEKAAAKEIFSDESKDLLWEVLLQVSPPIYAALYNHMIHESSWSTLSLHKTLKGAQTAIEFHRYETEKENGAEYCTNMDWTVEEYTLQD